MATAQQLLIYPSGGDPSFANVVLLVHMDNLGSTTFIDSSSYNQSFSVQLAQGAQSAIQVKFGAASMPMPAAAGGITGLQTGSNFGMGTGDFTMEGWFYPTDLTVAHILIDLRHTATNGFYPVMYLDTGGALKLFVNSVDVLTAAAAVTTNAWQHIAYSRASGSGRLFVNGTQVGSTYSDSNNYVSTSGSAGPEAFIGIGCGISGQFQGYIDEIRLTKGVGRYTTTFTAPIAAFPDS